MKAVLLAFALLMTTQAHAFEISEQAEDYRLHYGIKDPYTKLVNYEGNGFEPLYGTRNFRVVLDGVYYRGGANNPYNRAGKRGNKNPLQTNGLQNLCEEGFTEATYLYSTNYANAPHTITCRTRKGEPNTLHYKQINALMGGNEHLLLENIFAHIKGTSKGPIYDHCWNGWHASGYVAALSLIQFCGWTKEHADSYWTKNTDNNYSHYSSVRRMIAKFTPFNDLKITAAEAKAICPQ